MKRVLAVGLFAVLFVLGGASSSFALSSDLVVSQVYGGGGNSGAQYTNDFVELFNRGSAPVSLAGMSVQYASATGTGNFGGNPVTQLSGTLAPGHYYLVQMAAGSGGTTALPTPDALGTVNMSGTAGKVILANTTTGLGCNGGSAPCSTAQLAQIVDLVGYGGANFFEGAPAPGLSNTTAALRNSGGCAETDNNGADFTAGAPNPRNTASPQNDCASTPPPPTLVCGDPATAIHAIQGSGAASPLDGSVREIEGVVVGDFQNNSSADNGNLNGFFVQEETADADSDPLTSEGIFVFAPAAVDVARGDVVRVKGTVDEFNGKTELTSVSDVVVCSTGAPLPAASSVTLPVGSLDEFERYEGMYVTFPQSLSISEYFNFDRFGEIVLTHGRQYQPTAVYAPGSPAATQLAQQNTLSRITLDDGRSAQNPDPAIHPNGSIFDLTNRFRGGDTVTNTTGVLDYDFGLYRIQPTQGADYTASNPRPAAPAGVGGNVKVASFNVLNYFTTIDNAGPICGPAANQDCRGADNASEFTRQRTKIIAAITALNADIVGLLELENHAGPTDPPLQDLVDGLNAAAGAGTYASVATGPIGTDAIKVALIYKPGRVTPVGDYAILDSSVDPRFIDTLNRPALAQSFRTNDTGGVFTVAINHLKSKGSDCNAVGDPDTGDGSGNCNQTRTSAAQALVDWLATDPTGSGDNDFLIIGDLNSYEKETPIDALIASGYTELVNKFVGASAYSYLFDGQLGYLDHALAGEPLLDQVTGTTVWHINADEPDILDYDTSFKQPAQAALFEPNAYRSSDHDPVLVGLNVCDQIAPTLTVTLTPATLWPADHSYRDVQAAITAGDNFGPVPTVTLKSVTSNEPDNGSDDGNTTNDIQIIDKTHLKLRAERSGTGTGRVYTATYQATDSCGNKTIATAKVTVPRNQAG